MSSAEAVKHYKSSIASGSNETISRTKPAAATTDSTSKRNVRQRKIPDDGGRTIKKQSESNENKKEETTKKGSSNKQREIKAATSSRAHESLTISSPKEANASHREFVRDTIEDEPRILEGAVSSDQTTIKTIDKKKDEKTLDDAPPDESQLESIENPIEPTKPIQL